MTSLFGGTQRTEDRVLACVTVSPLTTLAPAPEAEPRAPSGAGPGWGRGMQGAVWLPHGLWWEGVEGPGTPCGSGHLPILKLTSLTGDYPPLWFRALGERAASTLGWLLLLASPSFLLCRRWGRDACGPGDWPADPALPLPTQHIPKGLCPGLWSRQAWAPRPLNSPFIMEIFKPTERKEASTERPGRALRTEANRRPLVKVVHRQALVPRLGSVTLNASFSFAGLSFPFWDEPWSGLSGPV